MIGGRGAALALRSIGILLLVGTSTSNRAAGQDTLAVVESTSPTSVASAENFTGTVLVGGGFRASPPARINGATVTFEAGARTHWHVHSLGQTLVVTRGTGRVQVEGGAIRTIRAGDVVVIPPGAKHWHGAAPTSAMTHVAIVELPESGPSTTWLEAVSEDAYRGVPGHSTLGYSRMGLLFEHSSR